MKQNNKLKKTLKTKSKRTTLNNRFLLLNHSVNKMYCRV